MTNAKKEPKKDNPFIRRRPGHEGFRYTWLGIDREEWAWAIVFLETLVLLAISFPNL